MPSIPSPRRTVAALTSILTLVNSHTVIVYPGWRGDNLIANCTVGVDDYSTGCFPYGMQWMYPCKFPARPEPHLCTAYNSLEDFPSRANTALTGGGMGISSNRTYWPLTGGAIAFQPGWFSGHSSALIYINMGLGAIPPNYSHPLLPVFEVDGPNNDAYPALDVCLPQVPLPANISVQPGDFATIQIVEAAKHGAALFSVSFCVRCERCREHVLMR